MKRHEKTFYDCLALSNFSGVRPLPMPLPWPGIEHEHTLNIFEHFSIADPWHIVASGRTTSPGFTWIYLVLSHAEPCA